MIDNFERDIAWLLARKPDATDKERDDFAHKVADLCYEGIEEGRARDDALEEFWPTK